MKHSTPLTLATARAHFRAIWLPTLRSNDRASIRLAWSQYIDALHRDRRISDKQVNTWDIPANFGLPRKVRSNPRAAEMDMPAPRRMRHHTIKVIATGLPADAKVMHGGHNIIHDPLPDGSPARRSGGRTMFGLDYAPRVSQAVVVVAGRNRLTFDIDPRRITEDPVDGSSVFVIPMDFGMVRPNPAVACSPNKKRDRYRVAKVMHQGEWVQNDGCWDAKGVPSYVGKGETGKRRVISKKAVRQKASRTPSRVKGVRARKRS